MRDRAQAQELLVHWRQHWRHHGFGYAVLRRRQVPAPTGPDVGEVLGFAGLKWQTLLGRDVLNLYYRFAPESWGQGFAAETATTLVQWANLTLPQAPVVARVALNNPASMRVAEKAGLRSITATDPDDHVPHQLLLSEAWSDPVR